MTKINFKTLATSADNNKSQAKASIRLRDWLLIFGVALSSVTALAIGPLNIGECLVLIWSILTVFRFTRTTVIRRFDLLWWGAFFVTILIGTAIGVMLTPEQTVPYQLLTWVYFGLIFISITTGLANRTANEIMGVLNRIGIYSILLHTALLLSSYLGASTLFGINLWYGVENARYSGGGDNPHYISLVSLVSIFLVFRLLFRVHNLAQRVSLFLLLACGVWIAWETVTTTILTSLLATIIALMMLYILQAKRVSFLWLVYTSLALWALIKVDFVLDLMDTVISSDPNGEGRILLWLDYFQTLELRNVLGLGPGTHAWDGRAEYHNLYLDILAMGGFFGFALFLGFLFYSLKKAWQVDILLTGPLLALIFYGLGGFSGRRLVFWVVFALIIALARKVQEVRGGDQLSKAAVPE